jgi:hypothetical protein
MSVTVAALLLRAYFALAAVAFLTLACDTIAFLFERLGYHPIHDEERSRWRTVVALAALALGVYMILPPGHRFWW